MMRRYLSSLALPLLAWVAQPVLAACPMLNFPSTPTSDFTVNADGTVTHNKTGLTWQRCLVGQTWSAAAGCAVPAQGTTMSWASALQAAASNTFAGYNDWRVPNIKELRSIVEHTCNAPSINSSMFFSDPGAATWSSTTLASNGGQAWIVNFNLGDFNVNGKTGLANVRLVRGGQLIDRFDKQADHIPNAFAFTAQSDVTAAATITSAGVTLAGLTTVTGIKVSNGSYAINGGSYTTAPGVVKNGDVITLRHTASGTSQSSVSTSVTIGGVSGSFASTTADTQAPVLSAVGVSGTSSTATTLAGTSGEAGTGYWVVLPATAAAPSATQIKAAQDASGSAASFAGNAPMLAAVAKNFSVGGLANGTAYTLYLLASDAAGNNSAVETLSFSTLGVPGAPTGIAASAGNAQATVTFTPPVSDGGSAIAGYTVVSSPAGGVDAQADSTATSHTVTGLANGTAYTFTVTARNSVGSSASSTASAAVTPNAPSAPVVVVVNVPDPQPVLTEINVGSGAQSINGGLPVRINDSSLGAALTLNSSGPLTFTVNGADLTVEAPLGTVLTVKQVRVGGKTVPVLALSQGRVSLTSQAAGQPLLALGDAVYVAGSAGTVVTASAGQVAVSKGTLSISGNAFAALKDGLLYAGEVAQTNAAGKISRVRLGSADGSGGLAGDPLPLTKAAAGLSVNIAIPRLAGAVARVTEGLEKAVASTLAGSGGQNRSGSLVIAGTAPRNFLPLGDITIDTEAQDGSSTTADGLTRVVKNGVIVTLAPALRDLMQFTQDVQQAVPGATLTVRDGGVLVVRLAGVDYLVRPASPVEAASGSAGFSSGSDGVLRYRDGQGGQQALYPAFYSYGDTLALLAGLGVTASVNTDGSIAIRSGQTPYTLIPDWNFSPNRTESVLHFLNGKQWWLGTDGRVYLNLGGGAQGVEVK
jgi:hypothetical protein